MPQAVFSFSSLLFGACGFLFPFFIRVYRRWNGFAWNYIVRRHRKQGDQHIFQCLHGIDRQKRRFRDKLSTLLIYNCGMALHELLIHSHTWEVLPLQKIITLIRCTHRQLLTLRRGVQLASCTSRETVRCSASIMQVK